MITKQIAPRKGQNRKKPNMHEKLASALLHIRRGVGGDDWLVKGDLREASARDICAAFDFDHVRRWAEGGTNVPQNLQPLPRAEHREKSRKDNTEVAKGKRFGKAHAEFQRKVLAKVFGETDVEAETPKRKAKIQSRNTLSKDEREKARQWKQRVTG
jgi:hypothetical protein